MVDLRDEDDERQVDESAPAYPKRLRAESSASARDTSSLAVEPSEAGVDLGVARSAGPVPRKAVRFSPYGNSGRGGFVDQQDVFVGLAEQILSGAIFFKSKMLVLVLMVVWRSSVVRLTCIPVLRSMVLA